MPMLAAEAPPLWRSGLSGLSATLVGVGLARFAYGPLLPAMVVAGWATPAGAAFIGAANLAGYLLGAMTARRLASQVAPATLIRGMLALASLAFFACSVDLGAGWLSAWRFAAGVAGAVLVVLAPPQVLAVAPPERRGLLGGVIFTGVGVGVVVSATIVPSLIGQGLPAAWLALGVASTLVAAIGWNGWPTGGRLPPVPPPRAGEARMPPAVPALLAVYGLNALGLVPHMVFLVDFVARGLGAGVAAGGWSWVAFGLGALAGPLAAGRLADLVGFARSIRIALALELAAVALPLLSHALPALMVSAAVAGAFTPGIVPLVLGRVQELVPIDERTRAWGWATISFAAAQAIAAYGLSAVFAVTGSHLPLFGIGAASLVLALAIDIAADPARRRG
ncbi:MAG TPA: YbfB/YjiJ family MFS transporter [Geminicoccaceae bacterium]|nr:YbfB/YjiJ family MFS transporter [Geminicoccus sp.]HMU51774.1 YbfB/YjiJ family MFS transporter [Geminicoccaceae bacterium]